MSAILDPDKVRFTSHATERAVEMGIDPLDVVMTLACPDGTRVPGPRSKYHGTGREFYDYGDYTAVVEPGEKLVVVTFLWRYAKGWEESYGSDPFSDRKRRDNPFCPAGDAA